MEKRKLKENRLYFLDNLRTFLIFLVVVYHSGAVYESSGIFASFWIVDDPATNNLVGIVNIVIDIFIMATMFFISGYMAPLSLNSKDAQSFLRSKFKRLMIPWCIAVFTLIPLYKVIFLYSRNLPQKPWTTYFHFSNGIFSQSWLWFLPLLFVFNALYIPFHKIEIKFSFKKAIVIVFLMSFAYSLVIAMLGAQGWTKTFLIDFQNERLLVYFLFFYLGSMGYKQKIFDRDMTSKKLYYLINSIAWIPITIYGFFLIYRLINFGKNKYIFSAIGDRAFLWLSFHLSLLCLVYLSIETFRLYVNTQGKIRKILNQNSYGVYIIHLIVVGCIALIMLNTGIPSLLKYVILVVTSFAVCHVIVSMYYWVVAKIR